MQKKGPVIVAMNHPNAFTDPVAVIFNIYPTRLYYLARGDAFKAGLVTRLLESLGIVPIFRIQDGGKEGLKKNEDAYRRVNYLLDRDKKMVVFAEGLCIQERRLRPLKKGVARMTFGAQEYLKNKQLLVIPVGVNYSQPDKLRSTIFYNVGEPYTLDKYMAEYNVSEAKGYKSFLNELEGKMKALITHINNSEYDETVILIEKMCKSAFLKSQNLNKKDLYDDYKVTKQITELVNSAEINNKEVLDEVKTKIKPYFKALHKAGMRDWIIDPQNKEYLKTLAVLLRCFIVIIGFPVYLTGLLLNYLPFKSTELITKAILKGNKEFYSSIWIGLATFIFLIYYVLLFIVVYHFSSIVLYPILAFLTAGITGKFALHFHYYFLKFLGIIRAVLNKRKFFELSTNRASIVELINKF
ncbi:MAG: 1-acyl-sn-glycerol-3-phosphate acyltransferase [Sphingobacteriaceae bacterium]|nr:1-acyl-sn-glycerol-3-phosphate acyltransferase [Sphingobacteriaceae bacterium]